jgi:hypothetical protein
VSPLAGAILILVVGIVVPAITCLGVMWLRRGEPQDD